MFKREDYISWDEYFLGIAFLSSQRSKDPITQVGACIVSERNRIIGIGYNGFPNGSSDDELNWGKEGDFINSKYAYVVHAELNAILNSTKELTGSTLYVTHHPCNECSKSIAQTGIKKVVYYSDKHKASDLTKAAVIILKNANIDVVKYEGKVSEINIKFKD